MNIVIISNNQQELPGMERGLAALMHSLRLVKGDSSHMDAVADRYRPDILVVEDTFSEIRMLTQIERLTARFPQTALLLACAHPTADFLVNAMRAGVREVLPSPITPESLEEAINRVAARRSGNLAQRFGKTLAFISCKGGSGATFLAANLGYQLAASRSVLLMDLDLQFGDALAYVHDAPAAVTLADVARDINRLDASFFAACTVKVAENYHILAAPEEPAQAIEVSPEHIDAILDLATTLYDFVIIDLSRMLDAVSIKALDRADRIFPVLQAGLPYLRNAQKLLSVFNSLGYPTEKTELVVNRFEKNSEISISDIRRALDVATIHTIRNSYREVAAAINRGDPIPGETGGRSIARNLSEFAQTLHGSQEQAGSWLGRLFIGA